MNSIFWSNSPGSGLCDRLTDISLMATFSRLLGAKLSLKWEIFDYYGNGTYVTRSHSNQPGNEIIIKKYHDNRYHDYLYENFIEYFYLPTDIEIFTQQRGVHSLNFDYIFSDYLGGIYSAVTFWKKYAQNICNLEIFIEKYNQVLKEFRPTENLSKITNTIEKPDLVIHLRRTDKVVVNPDIFATDNLESLNLRTIEAIDTYIKKNGPKTKIYFSSDDSDEKLFFQNKYKNFLIKKSEENYGFINTYVDMFLLSSARTIILSQMHSNFSIFCSLIGSGNLIYLYEDCPLVEMQYPKFKNFKLFTQI